jgi:hypothetical protein
MAQFVDGPPIGPGMTPATPPSGPTEVFIDSSAVRAAYYQQFGATAVATSEPVQTEEPAVQEVRTISVPDEAIPAEVLAAMRAGAAPSIAAATHMANIAKSFQGPPRIQQMPHGTAPHYSTPVAPANASMTLPLGSGVSVELRFIGGEPTPAHWRRLLRHLEIEAESENA